MAAAPRASRRDLADGSIELVEVDAVRCRRLPAPGAEFLTCAPGETTKVETTVIRLDRHRLPVERTISYDGVPHGRVRLLDVTWR
jgi:hypothetical protein